MTAFYIVADRISKRKLIDFGELGHVKSDVPVILVGLDYMLYLLLSVAGNFFEACMYA